ncbi:hypothetical protein ABIE67_009888 [Streptomyces sp. V4I8]
MDGVPVTVTCRVLKLARQPYYRWLDRPVTDAVLEEGLPPEGWTPVCLLCGECQGS